MYFTCENVSIRLRLLEEVQKVLGKGSISVDDVLAYARADPSFAALWREARGPVITADAIVADVYFSVRSLTAWWIDDLEGGVIRVRAVHGGGWRRRRNKCPWRILRRALEPNEPCRELR